MALWSFLAILGALAVGTMSPGPSFVMVSRTAVARSRADGLAAALGMGVGGAIFATLALVGLIALLAQVAWLYAGLKLAGGAYLIYLGWRIWQGAAQPLMVGDATSDLRRPGRSFALALLTQLSNPKTAIYYASIFAALLPPQVPAWSAVTLAASIFLLETGWYVVVALLFSSPRPRALYLGWKAWVDRLAGAVMALLGGRLIWGVLRV